MPISGVVLNCAPDRVDAVRVAVEARPCSEVRERLDSVLVVVTDTATLADDRAEVDALMGIDGVVTSNVVFSNIEDAAPGVQGEAR